MLTSASESPLGPSFADSVIFYMKNRAAYSAIFHTLVESWDYWAPLVSIV